MGVFLENRSRIPLIAGTVIDCISIRDLTAENAKTNQHQFKHVINLFQENVTGSTVLVSEKNRNDYKRKLRPSLVRSLTNHVATPMATAI